MRIRWFGQSAYLLTGEQRVFVDPFGDMSGAAARGIEFRYPAIEGVTADVLRADPVVALLQPPM